MDDLNYTIRIARMVQKPPHIAFIPRVDMYNLLRYLERQSVVVLIPLFPPLSRLFGSEIFTRVEGDE